MNSSPSTAPGKLNGNADANTDMRALVKDAQALLQAAAALTGEKADEMRGSAMRMLDSALGKAHGAQSMVVARGRQLAGNADDYVKENPWRTIAAVAGVGVLVGVILGRR